MHFLMVEDLFLISNRYTLLRLSAVSREYRKLLYDDNTSKSSESIISGKRTYNFYDLK